jgi:hypothetical protein
MEETRRGRRPPLKVERQFAGSRLELQILSRSYELAAPTIRRRTDAIPMLESSGPIASRSFQSQHLAKGA